MQIAIVALIAMLWNTACECAEVTVIAEHASASFTDEVHRQVASDIDEIARLLGYAPEEPLTVVLTASKAEFDELTGDIPPEWSSAVAIGGNRIVVAPTTGWSHDLNRIIVHEATHIVIANAAGDRYVPRWFHEGCAQYLAAEWGIRNRMVLVWHSLTGSLMTFARIEDVFEAGRVEATLAYDQSLLAVRHLIDRHGKGIIADIVAELAGGETFPNAFRETTGVWPSEFEEDYRARIASLYGWRSLYLLVPSVWTMILMLAVVAYIVKRRRNRRILDTWEIIEAAEKIVNIEDHRTGY